MNRWIGIDVAKDTFTAAQRGDQGIKYETFHMSPSGFEAFHQWHAPGAFGCCLESTGPYWKALAVQLDSWRIPYALPNPRKVRRFAQASEHRSKTDQLDAELLLRFAETFQPRPCPAQHPVYAQLKAISRRILQLQRQLDVERDRLEKASADPQTPSLVLDSCRLHMDYLKDAITLFEAEAKALVQRNADLSQTWDLLMSIPCIGPKTARTLIAEYGGPLGNATPRQMTRFAGLDIVLFESGTSVHKRPRISKQGNWRIRRALYLAALSAIRHNPVLAPFYQRKREQGLPPKQALVAVMRKLLHLVYGVLKHQTPFQHA